MRAVLVDLDDTLYDELEYVYSGFRAVAETIAIYSKFTITEIFNRLLYQFTKYGRTGVFDAVREFFGISFPGTEILINIYREHNPKIELAQQTQDALLALRKQFLVAIVTDGYPSVQRKKVAALKLEELVDKVTYCMDIKEPKPSALPYTNTAFELGISINDCIIVGDDPYCDMPVAGRLGVDSYRILYGKHAIVTSLPEALPILHCNSFAEAAYNILERYK